MGKLSLLDIQLSTTGPHLSGGTVSGHLLIKSNKDLEIVRIFVHLYGGGKVEFYTEYQQSSATGKLTTAFRDSQSYLSLSQVVLDRETLAKGQLRRLGFELRLPHHLPSSFMTVVAYSLAALVDRGPSGKKSFSLTRPIIVIADVDLNRHQPAPGDGDNLWRPVEACGHWQSCAQQQQQQQQQQRQDGIGLATVHLQAGLRSRRDNQPGCGSAQQHEAAPGEPARLPDAEGGVQGGGRGRTAGKAGAETGGAACAAAGAPQAWGLPAGGGRAAAGALGGDCSCFWRDLRLPASAGHLLAAGCVLSDPHPAPHRVPGVAPADTAHGAQVRQSRAGDAAAGGAHNHRHQAAGARRRRSRRRRRRRSRNGAGFRAAARLPAGLDAVQSDSQRTPQLRREHGGGSLGMGRSGCPCSSPPDVKQNLGFK